MLVRKPFDVVLSYGESTAGSTTTSAPQRVASARRAGDRSLATTVPTPRALSWQITIRPTGPQPITIAVSPFLISLRRTACSATAIGSVIAAMSTASPLGTGNVIDASART